jgi:hypothetical protein
MRRGLIVVRGSGIVHSGLRARSEFAGPGLQADSAAKSPRQR